MCYFSLSDDLDDLYKLQIAARDLEHGVKEIDWILFKPSKFVYSFFAFNSFYSIHWEETKKQKRLVKWEEVSSKKEYGKMQEMRKYIYSSFVKETQYEEEKKKAREEIAKQFALKVNTFSRVSANKAQKLLKDIVLDNRIDENKKSRFVKNFGDLIESQLLGEDFCNALDDVLYVIYLIRNNIFHGSKSIIEMSDKRQQERIGIYTAVLLAVNELLFEANEKNFCWVKQKKPERPRVAIIGDGRMEDKILSRTASSKFKIEIPDGILFYPCCGNDTWEPLRLFINTISEFHFVDNEFLPQLPNLACGVEGVNDPIHKRRSEKPFVTIPKTIVESAKATMTEEKVPDEVFKQLEKRNIEPAGFRNNITVIYKQEWLNASTGKRKIEVYRHKQDGLVTFMGIDKISVFFLRGDSLGEGGSGQKWFQESIFDLILEKLVDGGLLVTDGSGLDYAYSDIVPWKPLWANKDVGKREKVQQPNDFNYSSRMFRCIGECGHRYGPVYVWKVMEI